MQTVTKALERITKESSQGLDQTCLALPGEIAAAGQPPGSLLLSNLITFPYSVRMYKTDIQHKTLQTSIPALKRDVIEFQYMLPIRESQ